MEEGVLDLENIVIVIFFLFMMYVGLIEVGIFNVFN